MTKIRYTVAAIVALSLMGSAQAQEPGPWITLPHSEYHRLTQWAYGTGVRDRGTYHSREFAPGEVIETTPGYPYARTLDGVFLLSSDTPGAKFSDITGPLIHCQKRQMARHYEMRCDD